MAAAIGKLPLRGWVRPVSPTRKLSSSEVPDGSLIAVFNDGHIGIHDEAAHKVAIECCEREGVTLNIFNGDMHDCGPVAPHEGKARRARMENGDLLEEAASGRWIVDWAVSRPCLYGVGNHEDWINDLALRTGTVGSVTVASALGLPADMEILPHGYQIRLGSLVIEHGDITIGKSKGGPGVAQTILRKFPDQTTLVGHFHTIAYACRTTLDADDNFRTRAAHASGHMSNPLAHSDYAGRMPDWQQGFTLIRVWYENNQPRFTIHPIEIHRTRRGGPIFEFNGRVYR
jgi:hypothetical protein